MSKFPVEMTDDEGQVDAINYLLSGPSGLGQNFDGVTPAIGASGTPWVKGAGTEPFTSGTVPFPVLYVAPISLSSGTYLDDRTIQFTFSSAQGSQPFFPGDIVYVYDTSDDLYNILYRPIGVITCSTTTVTVRLSNAASPIPSNCTGGFITKDFSYSIYSTVPSYLLDVPVTTDCVSHALLTNDTDRVFINGQIVYNIICQNIGAATDSMVYTIRIGRYVGRPNTTADLPKISYTFDKQVFTYSSSILNIVTSGFTSTGFLNFPFSGIMDTPGPGQYMYAIEFVFLSTYGDAKVRQVSLSSRALSTQVVKE